MDNKYMYIHELTYICAIFQNLYKMYEEKRNLMFINFP